MTKEERIKERRARMLFLEEESRVMNYRSLNSEGDLSKAVLFFKEEDK